MNNIVEASYFFFILIPLFYYSLHDLNTRTVPNLFLAYFVPCALGSLAIYLYIGRPLLMIVFDAIAGFLIGGLVMLIPAMISNGGIGGADIKLAAMLGFIFGPGGILFILLTATALALLAAAICRIVRKKRTVSIPFIPFYTLAVCILFITKLY